MKVMILPHVTIIGVYRLLAVPVQQLCCASQFNIFIRGFNINCLDESNRRPLYNLFVNCNNYRQLISTHTTDNQTTVDHIYTNLPESQANAHVFETYFSDHKPICALINCFH